MWMWDEGTDGCLDTRGGLPVYANPLSRSMGVRAAGSRARCAQAGRAQARARSVFYLTNYLAKNIFYFIQFFVFIPEKR